MTDCGNVDVRERLPELMHGVLPTGERLEVERHLAGCAACSEELALLVEVRGSLVPAPAIDVERIVHALEASRRRDAQPPHVQRALTPAAARDGGRRWAQPWQRVAAAVLVVAGLAAAGLTATRTTRGTDSAPTIASEPSASAVGSATASPASTPVTAAAPVLSLGGVLSALSDAELESMISELDDMAAVPTAEPRPILLVEPATEGDGADS